MKYVYPSVFTEEEGAVLVSVPDLPGLHTFAGTIADALYMVQDAIEMWLGDAENAGDAIPPASTQAAIAERCTQGQFVSLVGADTDEYRRQNDTRAVKKTLTIPDTVEKITMEYGVFRGCSKIPLALQARLKRLGYTDGF